jgi:hypothetical protein
VPEGTVGALPAKVVGQVSCGGLLPGDPGSVGWAARSAAPYAAVASSPQSQAQGSTPPAPLRDPGPVDLSHNARSADLPCSAA